jgi:hypothetical protein
MRIRRRHLFVWIRRSDSLDQQAIVRIAWRNRSRFDGVARDVEPQLGLSLGGVGSMTVKTVLRQDRANVAIEVKNFGACR